MGVWETLEQARSFGEPLGASEARVALAETPSEEHRAWFGTDVHDRPVAYFEIGADQLQPFAISQVIDVTPVGTTIGSPPENVLTAKVTCREPRLDNVFLAFMEEVTSKLGSRSSVDVLVSCAAEWRNLLRVAKQGLSAAAAAGLYGELRFLENLIAHVGPASVSLWQREGKDVHDFIGDAVRVEVKTSSFQKQHSVTIHGLKQLEPPTAGALLLAVAEVEKHGAGETLDMVVNRILDRGAPLDVLTEKLEAAGFVRGMGSGEDAPTFSLRSWRFWSITDRSPVLTSTAVGEHISSSVSDVTYSLQLSGLGEPSTEMDWQLFQLNNSVPEEG